MLDVSKLFPVPANAGQARHQANVIARAERLRVEGYSFAQVDEGTALVTKPDGIQYEVDLLFEQCSCEGYKAHKFCSHLLAVLLWLDEDMEADRQAEEEEDARLLAAETVAEFGIRNAGYRA